MRQDEGQDQVIGLGDRINAIRAEVKRVAKDANVDGRYEAVTHDAVTRALRPLMAKHGVIDSVSLVKSHIHDPDVMWGKRKLVQYQGTYEYTVYNASDITERITITVEAHGDDNGDKGPGKAISYAKKYGQMKMFALETGEDDEKRVNESELSGGFLAYMELIRDRFDSIEAIKTALATDKVEEAREIFKKDFVRNDERDEQSMIWRAPTKGGIWTTQERKLLKEGRPNE